MERQPTIDRYRSARSDRSLAVLEGFHPLKHALRFGADVLEALSRDPGRVLELADELAPDVRDRLEELVTGIPAEVYEHLSPRPPDSSVVALARRPAVAARAVLADPSTAPVVLLESPTHLGNVGAAVRVAAGGGAAGVLVTGEHDPWHASALRGSAGLHFALPVAAVEGVDDVLRTDRLRSVEQDAGSGPDVDAADGGRPVETGSRPLVAVDPGGEPLDPTRLPARALLAFGSERRGLRPETLERADLRVRIPMRPGVSSLNLATSVAVILYGWRLRA